MENLESVLEAEECLKIISGAKEFFKGVSLEAEKIMPDEFVNPSRVISEDEIFLSKMTKSEKEKFSLYVFTKEKINAKKDLLRNDMGAEEKEMLEEEIINLENNKSMIKSVLWIEIYSRFPEIKKDFFEGRLHLRSDFSIVKKKKDKVSRPRDFHIFG